MKKTLIILSIFLLFIINCFSVNAVFFKVDESASYGGTINAIITDGDYIYAGGATTQKIYQYWITNLTKKAETSDYGGTITSLCEDDDYVYAGGATTRTINQYWKSNMTLKASSASYGNTILCMDDDDEYVYVGGIGSGSPSTSYIKKYWKSNLTLALTSVNGFGNYIRALVVDDTNVFLVEVATYTLQKFLKSDLSYVSKTTGLGGTLYHMKQDSSYLYIAEYGNTANDKALKYSKGLSKQYEILYPGNCYAVGINTDYLYIGGDTTKVREYQIADKVFLNETESYGGTIYDILATDDWVAFGGGTTNKIYLYSFSNKIGETYPTEATGIGLYNATLNGYLNRTYDVTYIGGFWWDIGIEPTGTHSVTSGNITNTSFSYNLGSLGANATYFFKTWISIDGTTLNVSSDTLNFTTDACGDGECEECNSTNLTMYENIVNATGSHENSYDPINGWTVWANYTGNNSGCPECDSTNLTMHENIINATGTHNSTYNSTTGWDVYANYTGNGSACPAIETVILAYFVTYDMYIIPLILFIIFFVIGYTSKKRSGGFFLIFAGFALLGLLIEARVDIQLLVALLMSPFAIFIMLLGVKKAFFNDEQDEKDAQKTAQRRIQKR